MSDFQTTLLVLGGLLVAGAVLSGLVNRSFVSLAALFVLAGFVLGDGALEVLSFDPRSGFVEDLVVVALILILFRDGLEVEDEEMRGPGWHVPLRSLVVAMPITAALIAAAAALLTDLSWTQAFLVGALLCPTDPVLSSSVVTNPRVPRMIRHSLNLESGLNDGLALPAVLVFVAALDQSGEQFVWWKFVLQDVSVGLAVGILVGLVAAWAFPRGTDFAREIPQHSRALFALGTGLVAYGVAVAPPHGNGLIAVFVCAIVLGLRRPDLREAFERQSQDLIELVKLGAFVVFGSLLTLEGLFRDGWSAVAFAAIVLLVVRPAALFPALAGTGLDRFSKAFMAWFGPKGVATIAFALLMLNRGVTGGGRIFDLVALVVFTSILLHGLTDTPGANMMARHAERRDQAADRAAPAA